MSDKPQIRTYVMVEPVALRLLADHFPSLKQLGDRIGVSGSTIGADLKANLTKKVYELAGLHLIAELGKKVEERNRTLADMLQELRQHFQGMSALDLTKDDLETLSKPLREALK